MWKFNEAEGLYEFWLKVRYSGYTDVMTGDYIRVLTNESQDYWAFHQYNKRKEFIQQKSWEFDNLTKATIFDRLDSEWSRMSFEIEDNYVVDLL